MTVYLWETEEPYWIFYHVYAYEKIEIFAINLRYKKNYIGKCYELVLNYQDFFFIINRKKTFDYKQENLIW